MYNLNDKHPLQPSEDAAEAIDRLRLTLEGMGKTLLSIDDTVSGLVPHGFGLVSSSIEAVVDAIEDISHRE